MMRRRDFLRAATIAPTAAIVAGATVPVAGYAIAEKGHRMSLHKDVCERCGLTAEHIVEHQVRYCWRTHAA